AGGADLYYDTPGLPATAALRKVTNNSGEAVFNPPVAGNGSYFRITVVQRQPGYQAVAHAEDGPVAATSGDLTQYVFVSGPNTSQTPTFEYTKQGLIEGRVFNDLDGTGRRQQKDPGMAGVTVYLDLNNNGRLDPGEPQTTTDADGAYRF